VLLEERETVADPHCVLELLTLALGVLELLPLPQEEAEAEPLSEVVVDGEGALGPVTVADVELLPEGQLLADTVLELLTDTVLELLTEAVPQEVWEEETEPDRLPQLLADALRGAEPVAVEEKEPLTELDSEAVEDTEGLLLLLKEALEVPLLLTLALVLGEELED
jgi:hypothetical protein